MSITITELRVKSRGKAVGVTVNVQVKSSGTDDDVTENSWEFVSGPSEKEEEEPKPEEPPPTEPEKVPRPRSPTEDLVVTLPDLALLMITSNHQAANSRTISLGSRQFY